MASCRIQESKRSQQSLLMTSSRGREKSKLIILNWIFMNFFSPCNVLCYLQIILSIYSWNFQSNDDLFRLILLLQFVANTIACIQWTWLSLYHIYLIAEIRHLLCLYDQFVPTKILMRKKIKISSHGEFRCFWRLNFHSTLALRFNIPLNFHGCLIDTFSQFRP